MLVSGDFWQLLQVLEKANGAEIVNHTLMNSFTLWDDKVIILQLRQNMQVKKEMDKSPMIRLCMKTSKIMSNFYLILERESYLPMQQLMNTT